MEKTYLTFFTIFIYFAISSSIRIECEKRSFKFNSFVCVCNSTFCDTVDNVDENLSPNEFQVFITNKDKYRLNKFTLNIDNKPFDSGLKIALNRSVSYQKIKGFGGAMTDAAGSNIASLSKNSLANLLNSYFSSDGIEFNIIRVPLAGTDFSLREYSYDDNPNDFNLTKFSLSKEDTEWKIPFIQSALSISKKNISLFASAWTAAPWMKTNNDYKGNGTLIGPEGGLYYQIWANYYLKFFQEYRKNGIEFWGVTGQNEPTDGYLYKFSFNAMGFTPESQAIFITRNLAPTLKTNGFDDIKIMILDDQRLFLPSWAERVFKYSSDTYKYVDGIAVHWYLDSFVPANILDITHENFPDKWIFATEACSGAGPFSEHVMLGDFGRAESYAEYIIQDLNHWVTGWTDWNMALNTQGGPNWANNFVDSAIIVNKKNDEFYKQPIFYSLGHFSKFIPEGSLRVDTKTDQEIKKIFYVAFYDQQTRKTIMVVLNTGETMIDASVYDIQLEKYINVSCEGHSLRTIVWFD